MDLDATDAAILRALQEDARASLRTIAKRIGVSVPTVSARLKTLEQLGIIRGYRVLLDSDRLETTSVALVIRTEPKATGKVARRIATKEWVQRLLAGQPGWILVDVRPDRRAELAAILEEVSASPGVEDVHEFVGARSVTDGPTLVPGDRLSVDVRCFECKGPIHGEPVKVRLDGRNHYFCCHACEGLFLERYRRIRAAAPRRSIQ